jgi:hypothetical protein
MKKISQNIYCLIFFLGIFLPARESLADWVVVIGEGTNATFSVEDKAFIRKGNLRQFWAISSGTATPNSKSAVVLHETDCSKSTFRVLYIRLHKDTNGKGAVVGESDFQFDATISDAERKVISFVCSL